MRCTCSPPSYLLAQVEHFKHSMRIGALQESKVQTWLAELA